MLKDGRLIKLDSGAFVRAPQSGRKVLTHEDSRNCSVIGPNSTLPCVATRPTIRT